MANLGTLSCEEKAPLVTEMEKICSRRGRILKALELILKTIKKERGYKTTIRSVGFDVKLWNDVTDAETPTAYIVDGVEKVTRKAGPTRDWLWRVDLFGCVKNKTLFEFEDFLADVKQCIEGNNNLLATCNKAEVNANVTTNQLFSEKECTHVYNMELEILYTLKHGERIGMGTNL